MSEENEKIISHLNKSGFIRDIEDNVWYTRDYSQRVSPAYYNAHGYNVFYPSAGFSNGKRFDNVKEFDNLMLGCQNQKQHKQYKTNCHI